MKAVAMATAVGGCSLVWGRMGPAATKWLLMVEIVQTAL